MTRTEMIVKYLEIRGCTEVVDPMGKHMKHRKFIRPTATVGQKQKFYYVGKGCLRTGTSVAASWSVSREWTPTRWIEIEQTVLHWHIVEQTSVSDKIHALFDFCIQHGSVLVTGEGKKEAIGPTHALDNYIVLARPGEKLGYYFLDIISGKVYLSKQRTLWTATDVTKSVNWARVLKLVPTPTVTPENSIGGVPCAELGPTGAVPNKHTTEEEEG
jgi:hypothetical protein